MKARENMIKKSKTRGDKKKLRIHIHIKGWAWENQNERKVWHACGERNELGYIPI